MSKEYSHLVLCNNDVLIPRGAIEGLMSDHPLTVPMCNESGAGYACKEQDVKRWTTITSFYEGIDAVEFVQKTLKIAQRHEFEFKPIKCWTGFCMCMSRAIIAEELPDGNLFDPKNINVGNDDDLARRVQAYIALGSFVYHFKGVSFNGKIADRDNLNKTY
jgi:GT2 family glycosyltransferase